MSYVPFRDRADFAAITPAQQSAIVALADRLEDEARQDYHRDSCDCVSGQTQGWQLCQYGAAFATVSAEEIIAALLVEGRLGEADLT